MSDDQKQIDEGAIIIIELLTAWKVFKRTHDYKDLKLSCCENSKRLFEALEKMELEIDEVLRV